MKKIISLRFVSFILSLLIFIGGFPVSAVSLGMNESIGGTSEYLKEDISFRDKFTKHYIDTDGSRYAVVFPEQVHYQKNNEWVEVNNSLILDSKGERYVSENDVFKADFSKNSTDSKLVTIEEDGYQLSWSIAFSSSHSPSDMSASANTNAMRIESRVGVLDSVEDNALGKTKDNMTEMGKTMSGIRYNGVFNDSVDIRYSVLHGKVEEDVILNSPNALTSYTLTINTNGLTAVNEDDGTVRFINAEGEVIFTLDAPWMKDTALAVSHDITVDVFQRGSVAYITYTPDSEWLNDSSRLYPVLIDPSFTSRTYTSNYEDTYVSSAYPYANYQDVTQLIVGSYANATNYAYLRILNIPAVHTSWEIENATLNVFTNSSSAPTLELRIVGEEWDFEDLDYNNQPISWFLASSSVQTLYSRNVYRFDLTSSLEEEYYLSEFCEYGFRIECTGSGYSQLFSSEYSNPAVRPVFVIQYSITPDECLEDGAVYSFKNSASNKYMTVYGGSTANGTNICQSYSAAPTLSQTFRLDYHEDTECYLIRSLCSSNGYGSALTYSYSAMASDSASATSGNVSLSSVDEEDSAWLDDQAWMILPHNETDLFKIVSLRDPGYAITAYGSANGTSGGTTSTSAGNIYVSEFNGAANQLWKIESGGIQLNNADNIKNVTIKDSVPEGRNYGQFFCPVTEFGETVSWSSNNAHSVSITSNGTVTTVKAGKANITATVTHTNGTTTTYSCTIYVVIQNGVYSLFNVQSGYRLEYENANDYSEGAVMEVYDYREDGMDDIYNHSIFKIKYLGSGKYSIRSMLRNDMGWTFSSDSELVMTNIGTSDSQIDNSEKWNIAYDSRGYYIYNNSLLHTITAPDDIDDNNIYGYRYADFDDLQHWTLTKITDSINGVAICDKVSVLPVGETSEFAAAVYSTNMYHNGQNGYTWSITSGSQYASINATTGVLTAVAPGSVTVKATYKFTTWYATYTLLIVPIPDGTYFFRNVEYDDKYMQIDDDAATSDNGAILELWDFDVGTDQRWIITHEREGYYSIVSVASGKAITAPSDEDASLTQTMFEKTYGIASKDEQLWQITKVTDGVYTFSPKSDSSFYMAAGEGTFISDARNVEKRDPRSDSKDEWTLLRIGAINDVELEGQEMTEWCWAASARMFAKNYYPQLSATQEECVIKIKNGLVNDPGNILETEEAIYFYTESVVNATMELYVTTNAVYTEDTMQEFLRNNHVILIGRGQYDNISIPVMNGGHATLISGYMFIEEKCWFLMLDPWDGGSYCLLPYEQIVNGRTVINGVAYDQKVWNMSIVYETYYADNTIPYFFDNEDLQ